MKRFTAHLLLLAGALAVTPAAAQKSGFDFRGLSLGMDHNAFTAAVANNSWEIPSYLRADGRGFSRAIEYSGIPQLDSLVEEVFVNTEGLMLTCPDIGAPTCVAVQSIKATFRFGRLHGLEIASFNGQEKVFRPYALAAMSELDARLGAGDKTEADIAAFFRTYNIDRAKTFAEVPIASWRGLATAPTGEPQQLEARVYVIRLTEKYDMFREESGVFTPWGACRIAVKINAPDVDVRWDEMKSELKKRAAR